MGPERSRGGPRALRWRIRPRKATGLYNGAALCDRSFCARHPVERHAPGTIQPTSRSHSNETLARTFQSPATMAWSSKKVIGVLVLALLFCAAIADAGPDLGRRRLQQHGHPSPHHHGHHTHQPTGVPSSKFHPDLGRRRLQQHGHPSPHHHGHHTHQPTGVPSSKFHPDLGRRRFQ